MPYLIVLRSAPIIVLAWIVHHQTGGDAQRTATIIAALMAIFPQVLMMMHEADFVPKPFLDVARTFGASPLQVRFYVRFLHAVPAFLEGMRLASSLCLVGVLVVEMAYPTDGIGKAIRTAMQQYEIADAFAALIVVIVVAYVWTIAFERAIGVLQGSLVGVAVDVDK
jgi:NitT/TauT family transport system permease protein